MNIQLPYNPNLPVHLLASCFNNTSATYKFYWFLSFLQEVENGETVIPKKRLFARMIANAWHTVNYYHVSFGKQDLIHSAVGAIKEIESIGVSERLDRIVLKLVNSKSIQTQKLLLHFDRNVPHRFLSPWIKGGDDIQLIQRLSQNFEKDCLYALSDTEVRVNPDWIDYLKQNARLLKDFCLWNLALFVQSRSPNVPDIPNKLVRPAIRGGLNRQRTGFWDVVLKELGGTDCIYTNKRLTIGEYAVEHFIPYNFISHDLIWNLIPADRSFNSVKSDKLPPLDRYFEAFFKLQRQAVEIIGRVEPKNKFLQEYLTIYPDLDGVADLPQVFTPERFKERIQPMVTIAANNGFQYMQ